MRRIMLALTLLVCPEVAHGFPVLDQDFSPPPGTGTTAAHVNDNSLLVQTATVSHSGTLSSVDAWVSIGYSDSLFGISVTRLSNPLDPFGGGVGALFTCSGPGSPASLPPSPCSFPGVSGPAPDGTTGFARAQIDLGGLALHVSPGDVLALEFFDQSGVSIFGSYTNAYGSGTAWFICVIDECRDPTGLGSPTINSLSPDYQRWITLSDPTLPPGDANQFDAFFQVYLVPEPGALSLAGVGFALAVLARRRSAR